MENLKFLHPVSGVSDISTMHNYGLKCGDGITPDLFKPCARELKIFRTPILAAATRIKRLLKLPPEKVLSNFFSLKYFLERALYSEALYLWATDKPLEIYTAPYYTHISLLRAAKNMADGCGLRGQIFLDGNADASFFSSSYLMPKVRYYILKLFNISLGASEFFAWAGAGEPNDEAIQISLHRATEFPAFFVRELLELLNTYSIAQLPNLLPIFLRKKTGLRGMWLEELRYKMLRMDKNLLKEKINEIKIFCEVVFVDNEIDLCEEANGADDELLDRVLVVFYINHKKLFRDYLDENGCVPVVISDRPGSALLPISYMKQDCVQKVKVLSSSEEDLEQAKELLISWGYPPDSINTEVVFHREPNMQDECMVRYEKYKNPAHLYTRKDIQKATLNTWLKHIQNGRLAPLFHSQVTNIDDGHSDWFNSTVDAYKSSESFFYSFPFGLVDLFGNDVFGDTTNAMNTKELWLFLNWIAEQENLNTIPGILGDFNNVLTEINSFIQNYCDPP